MRRLLINIFYFFSLMFRGGKRVLCILYRVRFKKFGKNFIFDPLGDYSFSTIEVGDNVYIGPGAIMHSDILISIGDDVQIGPRLTIMGGDHRFDMVGCLISENIKDDSFDLPVVIGSDVWIGANVTILKGVFIGDGCVIGAGSVVVKDVPKYQVACGVPAKVIRGRFEPKDLIRHNILISNRL